jgi:flavorubredoxin
MNRSLEEMKIEVVDPKMTIQYIPTTEDLRHCKELGRKVGEAIDKGV